MKKSSLLILSAFGLFSVLSIQRIFAKDDTSKPEQKYAEITFDKTTHNFGIFDVEKSTQSCYFTFKNTGNQDLIIISATASCGCTDPEYPEKRIAPGAKDSIKVTYDGTTRRPGVFRKVITVVSNGKVDTSYLYITGEMVDKISTARIVGELDSIYKK